MATFFHDFGRTFSSELQKSRRTLALWITFLFPVSAMILVVLPLINIDLGDENIWARYIFNIGNLSAFFLPFFIIALVGFYCYVEHKSNTWKHLLVQPVSRASVYFGKLGMVLFLLLISLLMFLALSWITAYLLHAASARFSFDPYYPDFGRLTLTLLKVYLASSVIITLQYWLSVRLRNLIVPMIIGLGLVILPIALAVVLGMAGLLSKKDLVEKMFAYDPYSYPFTHIFNFSKGQEKTIEVFPQLSQLYMGLAILICGLSYWDFSRKNIK